MPYGKHAGKPLGEISVDYFHALWQRGGVRIGVDTQLKSYILSRISAFKKENPDLLWT